MKLQTLAVIVVIALTVVFAVSYLKELVVKTEGFVGELPTCTYTAIPIPNAFIQNCSGTAGPFICTGYATLSEAQTACNSVLGCKGITYRLDTAMGQHYTLRSGYVADPTAPVTSTVSSFNGESSYLITNLAVCKPKWQEGAPWQTPEIQKTMAGIGAGTGAGAGAGSSDILAVGSGIGAAGTGVTIPGGTMVLTSAMNTIWANSMASQPAFLQGSTAITAAGAGAGTTTAATAATAATDATAATAACTVA
jgi:hypothetical protein